MGDCGNIITRMEELYQNPLAAYSTQQLKEELSRRRRDHVRLRLKLRLKIKRQLFHRHRRMFYKR